jgi:hypothetical protein
MKDDEGYKELIKMLRQEIHDLKQFKYEAIKLENLLQGYKKVIQDLSDKLRRKDS